MKRHETRFQFALRRFKEFLCGIRGHRWTYSPTPGAWRLCWRCGKIV